MYSKRREFLYSWMDGWMDGRVLPASPSRKRFAAIPPKFLHAGVVIRITPHANTVAERNLVTV